MTQWFDIFIISLFYWTLFSFLYQPKERSVWNYVLLPPKRCLVFLYKRTIKIVAKLFKHSEQRIEEFLTYSFVILLIIFGIIFFVDWLRSSAIADIAKYLDRHDHQMDGVAEIVERLRPVAQLVYNLFIIFVLGFFVLIFGVTLFDRLESVCEKSRYGDFVKTYFHGLKTIGHFLLLIVPLVLWVAMWVIGDTLDSVLFSRQEYSEYSQTYYSVHPSWIMAALGIGSIPLLIALYFPIIKAIKRCFAEVKNKKLLQDEVEDLKQQIKELRMNQELEEHIR